MKTQTLINNSNKLLLFTFLILLTKQSITAQCNWEGLPTVQVESYSDLETFGTDNFDKDSIFMNISIIEDPSFEDPIVDLFPLSNIKYLGGALCITQTQELTSLNGLQALTKIQGPLVISFNDNLISLDGIDNLSIIGDDLFVAANDNLISTEGTNSIDSLIGNFSLTSCPKIKEIIGFENINYIEGIDFFQCDSLLKFRTELNNIDSINLLCLNETPIQDLDFLKTTIHISGEIVLARTRLSEIRRFNNILHLSGRIRIEENALLTNFDAFKNIKTVSDLVFGSANSNANITEDSFSNLDSVGNNCTIKEFPLNDFNLINELDYIGGRCLIRNLDFIENLSGFEKFSITPSLLTVRNNEKLQDCTAICERVQLGLPVILEENPGCNSLNDLIEICGPSNNNEIVKSEALIYPNPVKNKINVKAFDFDEFKIFDVKGTVVLHGSSVRELNMEKLISGTYYLEFSNKKEKAIQKFIKM